jgi:hypothetical protein
MCFIAPLPVYVYVSLNVPAGSPGADVLASWLLPSG